MKRAPVSRIGVRLVALPRWRLFLLNLPGAPARFVRRQMRCPSSRRELVSEPGLFTGYQTWHCDLYRGHIHPVHVDLSGGREW